MVAAFTLINYDTVVIQSITFFIATLLWPMVAVGSGRFIPTLIVVMMMDLGTFAGTEGNNRFGPATGPVKFR